MRFPSAPTLARRARARRRGFTLLEICLTVFIMALLVAMSVPSLSGVFAERRLRASLEALDDLVGQAQRRSVSEQKTYLLVWDKEGGIRLCPDDLPVKARAALPVELGRGSSAAQRIAGAYSLELPAALRTNPRPEWAFWPTGNCEPAVVRFAGAAGRWTAAYHPLTGRPTLAEFTTR
jgi:prepilin-type N-terminal cleavage/methylation domain-containing protein